MDIEFLVPDDVESISEVHFAIGRLVFVYEW